MSEKYFLGHKGECKLDEKRHYYLDKENCHVMPRIHPVLLGQEAFSLHRPFK